MKILFINGLPPLPKNKTRGIFITKRLEYLKQYKDINFLSITPVLQESWDLKFFKKILGRQKSIVFPSTISLNGIDFTFIKIPVNIFNKFLFSFSDLAVNRILKNIVVDRYDLIHAHWIYPYGYIAYLINKRFNIPYIITAHGSDVHFFLQQPNSVQKQIIKTLENASKTIFVSKALLNEMINFNFSGKNSLVIPNGVDTNTFKILDRNKIKKELGLKGKVIGYVGGFKYIKGSDLLPDIFKKVYECYKDVTFLMVGDGEYKDYIKKNTQDLDTIFVGRVSHDKIPYYMNAMDIMVLPSRNEGFGAVLLEAMACGTYVIGSDKGAIPEVVKEYGSIIKEDKFFSKQFAEKICNMLNNNYSRSTLREYAKNYDWKKIIEKERHLYKELL